MKYEIEKKRKEKNTTTISMEIIKEKTHEYVVNFSN